jgi:outer membrane protein assembly factor BamA
MKRASSVCIVVFLLGLGPSAFGQAQSSPSIQRPCADEKLAGKPTLKHSQRIEERASTETVVDSTASVQPCEPGRAEANPDKPATIHFEGLHAISESEVLSSLRDVRLVPKNSLLDADQIRKCEAKIRDLLTEQGYRHAEVSSRIDNVGNQTTLTFVISEGPRLGISQIRFVGNHIFSSQLLTEKISQYLASYGEAGIYNPAVYEYSVHRLADFVRSQGYLQAKVAKPTIEESNGGLILTISVDEGALYRFGQIKFEGASLLRPEELAAMLPQRPGEIVDGEKLSSFFFEELKSYYGNHGYIQYTAEITPRFNLAPRATHGVVDFEITFDEGRRFSVGAIVLVGTNVPAEDLRPLVLLKTGDIYNQKLFENSIRNLNDTGLFLSIDKERDTDYRITEEEGVVNIAIKLKRKDTE